jgi:hypothetical protein
MKVWLQVSTVDGFPRHKESDRRYAAIACPSRWSEQNTGVGCNHEVAHYAASRTEKPALNQTAGTVCSILARTETPVDRIVHASLEAMKAIPYISTGKAVHRCRV